MLVNVSVALVPFTTVHAHVSPTDHHHGDVHGGHSHDFLDLHDVDGVHTPEDSGQVLDLEPTLTSQSSSPSVFWTHWLPLACVIAFLTLGVRLCLATLRPPRTEPQFISFRERWRPPLRAPPALSI
jgi:hypothetical protein